MTILSLAIENCKFVGTFIEKNSQNNLGISKIKGGFLRIVKKSLRIFNSDFKYSEVYNGGIMKIISIAKGEIIILNSNFENIIAKERISGFYMNSEAILFNFTMKNCTFTNFSSTYYGIFLLYSENSNYLQIFNSTFRFN